MGKISTSIGCMQYQPRSELWQSGGIDRCLGEWIAMKQNENAIDNNANVSGEELAAWLDATPPPSHCVTNFLRYGSGITFSKVISILN